MISPMQHLLGHGFFGNAAAGADANVVCACCIGQCRLPVKPAAESAAAVAATVATPAVVTVHAMAAQVNAAMCGARVGPQQHARSVRQLVGRDGRLPGQRDVGGRAGAVPPIRRVHAGGASLGARWRLRKRGRAGVGVGRVPSQPAACTASTISAAAVASESPVTAAAIGTAIATTIAAAIAPTCRQRGRTARISKAHWDPACDGRRCPGGASGAGLPWHVLLSQNDGPSPRPPCHALQGQRPGHRW